MMDSPVHYVIKSRSSLDLPGTALAHGRQSSRRSRLVALDYSWKVSLVFNFTPEAEGKITAFVKSKSAELLFGSSYLNIARTRSQSLISSPLRPHASQVILQLVARK